MALSKQDLNPEITKNILTEMKELNTNIKFTISSFNNSGIENLTNYLFEKCVSNDDR